MNERRFDDVTRAAASLPRRRSLLLGGVGLAAAMAGASVASADKKSKKTCKKQKKQCRKAVQNFCGQFVGEEAESCLEAVLPCCASCKVKAGVLCTLNVI